MGKKIYLTEEQLANVMMEVANMGAGIPVQAKTDAMGKVTQQTLSQQKRELSSQGMQDSTIAVDQDTIAEEKEDLMEGATVYTKRQLKEARNNKITEGAKKVYKKKDI
jgi:hypothetical protein